MMWWAAHESILFLKSYSRFPYQTTGNNRYIAKRARRTHFVSNEVLLHKALNGVRVPQGGDKVYKDECVYSFDNPVSATWSKCMRPRYMQQRRCFFPFYNLGIWGRFTLRQSDLLSRCEWEISWSSLPEDEGNHLCSHKEDKKGAHVIYTCMNPSLVNMAANYYLLCSCMLSFICPSSVWYPEC